MSKYFTSHHFLTSRLRYPPFFDLMLSSQGHGDAGPEGGEEGQGFGGRPAPSGHLEYTTGGGGEQPPAQPPA